MNKLKWLGILFGLGIVVYLFYSIGWADILERLSALGWHAPLIFLPFLIINYIDTWAWVYTFPPPFSKYRLSFSQVFWIRICGESVNNFTPTAHVGGEVTRVLCLKKLNVSSTTGLVTVIMDKAALVITEILFIFTGIFLLLGRITWPEGTPIVLGILILLAIITIYAILGMIHKGILSKVSGFLAGRLPWESLKLLHEKVKHLDTHLHQFYRNHPREFLWSNWWHYVGWIAGVLETWTILYLMGMPVGLVDALLIEAMTILIKGVGFMIPGSLGIFEGGSVLFFVMLKLGEGQGLVFSLLKRAREIFFGVIGWIILTIYFSSGNAVASESPPS